MITKKNDSEIVLENMNIVIVGHVDHGKSTIIGRLLADTDSLPKGKLDMVRETCRRNSKPFEYAFLLDALKDEQAQGITIDSARCFFKTAKRNYIIVDAPGHIEFLKNMVTGAASAEAALLVIDASEGVMENSKRHGYMLSMLGIKQVSIIVNKMDLVNYSQDVYNGIVQEYSEFLKEINITPSSFIPASGMNGDNLASISHNMNWYSGSTVLEQLDIFEARKLSFHKAFRMPVQGVYKFTRDGDSRRIIAGTVDTGRLSVGDQVIFYPSGKQSRVKTIEEFNNDEIIELCAGKAAGFTLEEQIYVKRGELVTVVGAQRPKVSTRIKANLFWLGKEPMIKDKEYLFKLGTAKVKAKLEEVIRVIDASTLSSQYKDVVNKHDIAECIISLDKAIAFDISTEFEETSRFVIVDNYEISGGGIINEELSDKQQWLRDKVFLRNYKWEKSIITKEERAEKYNQKAALILITGEKNVGKKPIAKTLEKRLFTDGKVVYFLGIGNVLYGVDADIKEKSDSNEEHLRRMAEVANIMLDSGTILIVTAVELSKSDLDIINATIDTDRIITVWVGDKVTTDIDYHLKVSSLTPIDKSAEQIKILLQDKGIIFKAW